MSGFEAIPAELRDRDQWLLWDASADTPRRPHWRGNFGISWSDPDDWHSFEDAVSAAQERDSWGIGYVMALDNDDCARGLYGCLDLDGCVADDGRRGPKEWLPGLGTFLDDDAYVEYSASGEGIHIPLVGQEPPEWWRDSHFSADEHEGVEYLTNKFVAFTGDKMPEAGDTVADTDPAPFLHEAYAELNGESPVRQDSHDYDGDRDGDELTESEIRDALDHVDSGVPYPQWRDILFAIHDWDATATGRSVAADWSMGPGWDDQAEELIDKIWSGASQGDGITVGTLIHTASENGWSSSRDERADGTSVDSEGDAEGDEWGLIRLRLREASDADERDRPRFDAAMKLHTDYEFLTLEANDQLYVYDDDTGIYNDNGEGVVRCELTDGLEEQYRAHAMSEALDHIRGRTVIPKDDIGGPAGYVAADNCVIDLDNGEAREHSPEYRFLSRLGCEYDPDADAPRFRAFVQQVVPKESDRKKLQEYAGYTLMHWALPYHKALFLVGPTASGKSTFLDTINAMLGADTVASLTPQQLTTERFSGAELFEKWANIRNDIPAATVENTGMFKEIIGGDPMKAERKRKDPFMFEPTAKHLFAANELPSTETDDEAFYRRILLVPFPETVPAAERDKHLDDKLQAELPGVLNWALTGYDRLRQQGGFTADRTPGQTQETWQKWADSVSRFESAALTDGDDAIAKSDVYAAYIEYCRQEGIPSDTQHSMTRSLKLEGYEDGRTYIDGDRQRVFLKTRLSSRGKELLDDARSETSDETESRRRDNALGEFE
jgi:P4 family phage/plasmid primase-like protien